MAFDFGSSVGLRDTARSRPTLYTAQDQPVLFQDQIRNYFPPASIERGQRYFEERRIPELYTDNRTTVIAQIHGTKIYEVAMRYRGKRTLWVYCSCPYYDGGNYCKHLWALALQIAHSSTPVLADLPTDGWLSLEHRNSLRGFGVSSAAITDDPVPLADDDTDIDDMHDLPAWVQGLRQITEAVERRLSAPDSPEIRLLGLLIEPQTEVVFGLNLNPRQHAYAELFCGRRQLGKNNTWSTPRFPTDIRPPEWFPALDGTDVYLLRRLVQEAMLDHTRNIHVLRNRFSLPPNIAAERLRELSRLEKLYCGRSSVPLHWSDDEWTLWLVIDEYSDDSWMIRGEVRSANGQVVAVDDLDAAFQGGIFVFGDTIATVDGAFLSGRSYYGHISKSTSQPTSVMRSRSLFWKRRNCHGSPGPRSGSCRKSPPIRSRSYG